MFWLLMLVFVIITPIILAKSMGYKIEKLDKIEDLFSFSETGGIYVHSNINNTSIYLNGEYVENNGLLIRNTLIQNLEPQEEYEIVIQKEGFHDWRKKLTVYPSLVNEVRVLMLPKEIPMTEIIDTAELLQMGFATSTVLIADSVSSTKPNSTPAPVINTVPKKPIDNIKNPSGDSADISDENSTSTKEEIPEYFAKFGIEDPSKLNNPIYFGEQVAWLENGNIRLIWTDDKKTAPYYYCLEWNNCRNEIVINWSDEIKQFDLLPGRDDVFVVLVKDGIFAVEIDDRSDRNIQPIYLGENLEFKKNIRGQIVVSDNGKFYQIDL